MIRGWIERMNPRERVLATIVAVALFLVLNLFIWSSLLGAMRRAHADLVARRATRMQQSMFLKERDMWEKRAEWLKNQQPTLKSPVEASTLLDDVKQVAAKHNILIENPALGSGDSNANYQSVYASIDTKSPWPPLVHFLYDAQKPEAFVVFESVNLAIDSADPTMMRGKFRIARWFAPKT
jgi:hypothetical protein